MSSSKKMMAIAVLTAFVSGTGTASAAVTLFTDPSTWQLSVSGATPPITFDGIAASNSFVFYTTPPGVTIDNVTFGIPHPPISGELFILGPSLTYYPSSVVSSQRSTSGQNVLTISFPSLVTAAAFNYGGWGTPGDYTVTLSSGDSFLRTASWPSLSYVGMTTTTPFNSITISSPNDMVNVDNFTLANIVVPEPTSFVMVLAGLGLLAVNRFRQARR